MVTSAGSLGTRGPLSGGLGMQKEVLPKRSGLDPTEKRGRTLWQANTLIFRKSQFWGKKR